MLISTAYAAPATGAASLLDSPLPMFVVIALMFWFMIIRPQMKQAKEQRKMIEALQKGDEVTTSSGIIGRVTKVGDAFVGLEIAPDVSINVQKSAVQTLLPKGTIKSL